MTDDCGNSLVQFQTVTVADTLDPTFIVPNDTIVYLDINCQLDTTTTDIGTITATADNCSGAPTITYVDDLTNLTGCNNTGTFTRTWTVTDDCGNSTVEIQTVTVADTLDPTFTVPADLIVYLDLNCQLDTTTLDIGDVTDEADNCGTGLEATYVDDLSGLTAVSYTHLTLPTILLV